MKINALTTASLLAFMLFTAPSVMGQTFFDISADTTEIQEKESKKIDANENKTFNKQNQPQMNGSPVQLINAGGNYHLASKDPSKRNPLAPPPLSSDDISIEENATYQALVNFLRTCIYRPPGSDLPGLNQSLLNFQNIPPIIESKTDIEKREQKQREKEQKNSESETGDTVESNSNSGSSTN